MIARSVVLALIFFATALHAQTYPSKPVRVVLTNPPGGTTDTLARVLGDELGKALGQPFVLENRPGANGTIGGEIVASAPADGHTLLLGPPGPIALNTLLYARMPYDPKTAFAPVSLVAIAPLVLVVNPGLSLRTVRDLIEQAKAQPGKLSYGSQGNGSMGHLSMELFKSMTGVDIVHVPYKGSAPAIADLLAGRIQLMFDNTTSSLPHVRSGALRALAVGERARLKAAPEIPTVDDAGVKGFQATPWFGIVTRAGTAKENIDRLAANIAEIVRRPAVDARFAALGVELKGTSPEEFARHIDAELAKWERIVKQSGAKLD
jgi:tripartite-type tricarboxylate transporter receptor subunit TctC